MEQNHTTSTADLDLDGVPATHRHGIRALRTRLAETDGVSIDHVYTAEFGHTVVFLDVEHKSDLFGSHDVRRALCDTGVDKAEVRFGSHNSIMLDYVFGFEV